MFGSYLGRSIGTTYTALTDGFVVATVGPATSPNGKSIVYLLGYVNGNVVARALGGNVGFMVVHSSSDWTAGSANNDATMIFPVPKGASWAVTKQSEADNQYDAYTSLMWIPFGTTQTSADDKPVAETGATQHATVVQTYESDVNTSIADLVNDLASIFERDLSAEAKQRLEDRVYKLVQMQPSPKLAENFEPAMVNLVHVLERVLKQSFAEEERTEIVNAMKQLM